MNKRITWKDFKNICEKQGLKDSDVLDYIDCDIIYHDKPKIIVDEGREPQSKKVWSN